MGCIGVMQWWSLESDVPPGVGIAKHTLFSLNTHSATPQTEHNVLRIELNRLLHLRWLAVSILFPMLFACVLLGASVPAEHPHGSLFFVESH
eukprot:m.1526920 g.1526920  ORF g.1526920 m.1526920 type:complete len:92 (-) comp25234_c0_seq55:2941-3216(-)